MTARLCLLTAAWLLLAVMSHGVPAQVEEHRAKIVNTERRIGQLERERAEVQRGIDEICTFGRPLPAKLTRQLEQQEAELAGQKQLLAAQRGELSRITARHPSSNP